MKISYRTHPALKYLSDHDYNIAMVGEDYRKFVQNNEWSEYLNLFEQQWDAIRSKCITCVDFITEPFYNAVKDNAQKLIDAQLYKNLSSHCGVIFYQKACFCYNIEVSDKDIFTTIISFNDEFINFFGTNFKVHYCNNKLLEQFNTSDPVFVMKKLFTIIEIIVLFKQYAEVETCDLKPGQRKNHTAHKYVNETGIKINILDSKWFTTLVKSDAFKVRGHFRLQPYGEGLKDRKLIWISDFVKDGYTAPARKLSNT